jgi:hypothetical protein
MKFKGGSVIIICIKREESVYFNIRGEGSVICASFKRGKCNLLYIKIT